MTVHGYQLIGGIRSKSPDPKAEHLATQLAPIEWICTPFLGKGTPDGMVYRRGKGNGRTPKKGQGTSESIQVYLSKGWTSSLQVSQQDCERRLKEAHGAAAAREEQFKAGTTRCCCCCY